MIFSSLYLYFSSLVLALPFYPPHFYYLSRCYPTIHIMKVNKNLNNQLWKYEENFLQLFSFYDYIHLLSRLLWTGLFFHFLSHLPLSLLSLNLSVPFSPSSLTSSLSLLFSLYLSFHSHPLSLTFPFLYFTDPICV